MAEPLYLGGGAMKFHFFDHNDQYLGPRTDAARFITYERDLAFEGDFPPTEGPELANGQRVAWLNDDEAWQVYEIDKVDKEAFRGDVLFSGVHLAVAELRDVIIDKISFDNVSIMTAMDRILSGTGWTRGTIMGDSGTTENVDIYTVTGRSVYMRSGPSSNYKAIATYHRGDRMTKIKLSGTGNWMQVEAPDGRVGWMSVSYLQYDGSGTGPATAKKVTIEETTYQTAWALLETAAIKAELLIMPRVEIAQDGTWTRAIDMHTVEPEYRGIRVTTRTDVQEARIQYDSSQVYTRLIGLGKEDLTFKDVVWKVSSGDPVNKPAGQNYVELPASEIAAITRNGRPRTGAYFVDDVSDASVLLQKTWERLQKLKEPQITLDARIADLYKMGYGGQSMRLYDSVQVILEAIDTRIMARIIDLERDWLRPENTRPIIGTSLGADILDDIRISSNLR